MPLSMPPIIVIIGAANSALSTFIYYSCDMYSIMIDWTLDAYARMMRHTPSRDVARPCAPSHDVT